MTNVFFSPLGPRDVPACGSVCASRQKAVCTVPPKGISGNGGLQSRVSGRHRPCSHGGPALRVLEHIHVHELPRFNKHFEMGSQ